MHLSNIRCILILSFKYSFVLLCTLGAVLGLQLEAKMMFTSLVRHRHLSESCLFVQVVSSIIKSLHRCKCSYLTWVSVKGRCEQTGAGLCEAPGAPSEEKEQEKRRDLFYEELLAGGSGDLTDLVGVLVQAQSYDLLQGEVGAGVVEGGLQVLTDLLPVPETDMKTPVHVRVFTVHFVCFVTTVQMNSVSTSLSWPGSSGR